MNSAPTSTTCQSVTFLLFWLWLSASRCGSLWAFRQVRSHPFSLTTPLQGAPGGREGIQSPTQLTSVLLSLLWAQPQTTPAALQPGLLGPRSSAAAVTSASQNCPAHKAPHSLLIPLSPSWPCSNGTSAGPPYHPVYAQSLSTCCFFFLDFFPKVLVNLQTCVVLKLTFCSLRTEILFCLLLHPWHLEQCLALLEE